MRLKQLSYFAAIVENGSFSAAAKDLYIAQSSLSSSIAALEQELGFPLLVRTRSGVTPTDMGAIIYRDIKDILRGIEKRRDGWQALYRERLSLDALVRVAVVPGAYPILTKLLSPRVNGAYPNLHLRLSEGRGSLLLRYLTENRADLIFSDCLDCEIPVREREAAENGLCFLPLRRDHYKLAVRAGSPLAKKETLTPEDVAALPLACYFDGDAAAEEFFARGFDRVRALEYNSIEKIIEAALSGEAVGCLPEFTIQKSLPLCAYAGGLEFKTLEGFAVPFLHFAGYRRADADAPEIAIVKNALEAEFASEAQ